MNRKTTLPETTQKKHRDYGRILYTSFLGTCMTAVLAQPAAPNSVLFDGECVCDKDHFKAAHPDTNWQSCLEHAEKLGLGVRQYELVKI